MTGIDDNDSKSDYFVGEQHGVSYKLPQIVRRRDGSLIFPHKDTDLFVRHELDYGRLDAIFSWLWLAGRMENIRPLHKQIVVGRKVLVTEQADLHLLWQQDRIYIKPLGGWMFDRHLFSTYVRADPEIYAAAIGFLQSYLALVSYESDHRIASELGLLPTDMTWERWTAFVGDLIPYVVDESRPAANLRNQRCPRYRYGELRLNRIHQIYRFNPAFRLKHFCRGYFYGYRNYRNLIQRNFAWLLIVFVYITIVLTAMQVGLATGQLRNSNSFNAASYGFAVFSLVLPVVAFVFWLCLSVSLATYHVTVTLLFQHRLGSKEPCRQPDSEQTTLTAKSRV